MKLNHDRCVGWVRLASQPKSAIADLGNRCLPISGKPEIGCRLQPARWRNPPIPAGVPMRLTVGYRPSRLFPADLHG